MSAKLVYIDPGHGGKDPGACSGGVKEAEWALEFSERLAHYLRLLSKTGNINSECELGTLLSRENGKSPSIAQRAKQARDKGAALLLSIHANASAVQDAHGAECWVSADGWYRQRSKACSGAILKRLTVCGFANRGVKPDNLNRHGSLGILRGVDERMPAVLVEAGFLTNERDRLKLTEPESREIIAMQIAAGVCEFFAIEPRMDLVKID